MIIEQIKRLKGPLLLLLICFIAYLPLSSFLFALKNDAFIYNFPNKYFFSEALRRGYLPTWNPYLNFGFPLYADPGFAWWHPITWLFGIIGYNAYTFTIEVLLYIYIAGLGMYSLGRGLNFNKNTSLIMGCMFMCSGFFIGNLQHINFITCAAFLPLTFKYWLRYQANPELKNLLFFSFTTYLLCTGGHPAIPIAFFYFISLLTVLYLILEVKTVQKKRFLTNQLKLFLPTLVLLSPLLFSYLNILPFYSRSEPVNQTESLNIGFTLPSYTSFIVPFATIKNTDWFGTDISMRNGYFTLPGAVLLIISFFLKEKTNEYRALLITGVCMLFLAAGGAVKNVLYEYIPGLNYIRTNGELRAFSIFCFITCSAYFLNEIDSNKYPINRYLSKSLKFIIIVSSILSLLSINYLLQYPLPWSHETGELGSVKFLIDHISFKQSLSCSAFILLFLSSLYLFALVHKKHATIFLICILIDVFINSWLLLPFTGVGKASVEKIQGIINQSPRGFPIPALSHSSEGISQEDESLIGNWSWYDKNIVHKTIEYPSQLNTTKQYLDSSDSEVIRNKPFVFTKQMQAGAITIQSFSPSYIKLGLHIKQHDTLILLQNYFPGWMSKIDGKKIPIQTYLKTFISVPVNPGTRIIEFYFSPFSNNNFFLGFSKGFQKNGN